MANILWFRRGDGVEFCCVEGSTTHERLIEDGFELISGTVTQTDAPAETDAPPEPAATNTPADPIRDLTKLSKADLVVIAKELGLAPVPDSHSKAKIIAAIEAARG